MEIEMAKCKKGLGILWLLGASIIFFLLLIQTIGGHYGEQTNEAWHWFLPTVMPTLSLIISAWVIDARGQAVKQKPIRKYIYRGTQGLATFYIFVVLSSILAQPFTLMSPVEWLNQTDLWLGPLQGLVIMATSIFFQKK